MTRVLNHFLVMKEVQAEINTLSVIHELVTGHRVGRVGML